MKSGGGGQKKRKEDAVEKVNQKKGKSLSGGQKKMD
jgi:hypothetical protein